jgi:FAD dependent oxidoreductase TIGR03364
MPYDLAVVGAGILGLAHAYTAARAGKRVVIFERDARAVGASVRNFGMVWPVGQREGPELEMALASRRAWLELSQAAGFWASACGSIHAACREDELQVLREFCDVSSGTGRSVSMLSPEGACEKSDGLRRDRVIGALWSETEVAVDPREAVPAIASFLQRELGVDVRFGVAVSSIEEPATIVTGAGERVEAGAAVVCSGSDFRTLFPDSFAETDLVLCKLQMMRTGPQPEGWRLGPHLAGGLTLRHYASFDACPSLAALRARVADEHPELDRHGIHVMAAQNGWGELVLGDSHEYADGFGPDLSAEIESLMLRELGRWLDAPRPEIRDRWYGVYAKKLGGGVEFTARPRERVRAVTGVGGAGMTLSFGLAERTCAELGLT